MSNFLDKNIIQFEVSGAIDFMETLTFELYSKKTTNSKEISTSQFLKMLCELYPVLYKHFKTQISLVETDRDKNIWIKCVHWHKHSHEGFNSSGKNVILNLDEAIKKISTDYTIEFKGWTLDGFIKDLQDYFSDDIIINGEIYKYPIKKKRLDKLNKLNKI